MQHAHTYDKHDLVRTTLAYVAQEQAFWVCRGDRITNIKDLANCIESLTPAQFSYHVDPASGKNHFADWIEHTLRNKRLAHDLHFSANMTDQKHFVKTIRDHIHWLEH